MKVYTFEGAPNPQRLAMFMRYKGIELNTEVVDMANREQLSDAYRAINPDATVPCLVLDDGEVISQVIGMCVYLEEVFPDKPLLGHDAKEKGQVFSWCHKLSNGLFLGIASVFRNRSKGFVDRALPGPLDLPQIPAMVERGMAQIHHHLPLLDERLAESTWLAGEHFTLADIDLLTAIGFLGWIKEPVPEELTHLHAWLVRAQAEVA